MRFQNKVPNLDRYRFWIAQLLNESPTQFSNYQAAPDRMNFKAYSTNQGKSDELGWLLLMKWPEEKWTEIVLSWLITWEENNDNKSN